MAKRMKKPLHVVVVVRGGCVLAVHGLPRGAGWDLIDFDNLEADAKQTLENMSEPTLALFKRHFLNSFRQYEQIAAEQQS